MIGRTLGHYRVLERLGSGGMGVVYKAEDVRLHRLVAVKVLPAETADDAVALERFRREVQAASALNHPNICTIHDVGVESGESFVVMELLEGETLEQRIARGAVAIEPLVAWGIEISDALDAAHSAGILHRDLKPANLFITRRDHAKILDFGLAKLIHGVSANSEEVDISSFPTLVGPALTQVGSTVGTIAYMSPEQARGESLDARSDLFSLGAVLYEMATGTRPFNGATPAAIFDAMLHRTPTPVRELNPQISVELERIVARALEKNRTLRYAKASEIRADLQLLRHEDTAHAAVAPARPSVAVLYFDNLSGAAEDEYFRDGMTEDITTELAKIGSLRVFPRAAVAPYRGRPATATEVGRELKATHVLGGSLRRAGDRLRVTVQMVQVSSGHAVWAERFDRELKDIFDVQEEIARSIAQALRISLSPVDERQLADKATVDLGAYDYFLRGRDCTRRENRALALEMFEKALQLDSGFALAHAGIASNCAMQYYLEDHDPRWLERAVAAVDRALALVPGLPEALVARARIHYAREEYDEAVAAARAAIAQKADCESAWEVLGRALFASDRWQEAADLVERAVAANGDDYNLYIPYANALQALELRAEASALSARHAVVLERQVEWAPEDVRARIVLANTYARQGRESDARRQLTSALALGSSDPHNIYNSACTYGILGLRAEALATLKRATAAGFAEWDLVARDPDLACLHNEPEFERFLAEARSRE